ncbi:MAG: sensor histidine kinase [Gammaproteobacteria bacterium]
MKVVSQHVSEAERQRPLFQRSILILSVCSGMVLVLLLSSMVFLSWLDFQGMVPVREHLRLYDELEAIALSWEHMLLRRPADRVFAVDAALAALTRKLQRRAGSAKHLEAETAKRLLQLTQLFAQNAKEDTSDPASALQALLRLREALKQETRALRATLDDRFEQARQLWEVSAALSTLLVALTGVGLVTAYLRLVRPLRNLAYLMALIARHSYTVATTRGVDPVLEPLFDRYNEMINRITALDSEHQAREETLEHKVDQATRTLIQQNAALMRVERLAATGEMAASLAHELRNPLAGTLSALSNLASEVQDEEQRERIEIIIGEVKRMARLLHNMLDQARHRPELPTNVDLTKSIHALVELVRYQIPEHVRLVAEVPDQLHCRLPENRLHQALLNLILNASQARRQGLIRVSARRSGPSLSIEVQDDGPGFPPELLKQGPHAFFSQRQGGTGLGLASVQRLAKDLGGRLTLQNVEPHGACASLELPYVEAERE